MNGKKEPFTLIQLTNHSIYEEVYMRKHWLLMIAALVLVFSLQAVMAASVTFQVNMSNEIKRGNFDPMTQVVRITGDLVEPNWNPAQAPILEDEDGDYIFTTTLEIADGDYEYKYLIGSDWGNDELQGQPNRSLTVSGDATLEVVWFNNLSEITLPPAGEGKVNVHLAVNMTRKNQIGQFNAANDTVRVTGNIVEPNWSPPDAPIMEDPDSNLVYVTLLQVDTNATYEYKYLLGSAWGNDELQGQPNRSLTIGYADTILFPVYFDNDPYVPPVTGDTVDVTLQVNMRVKALEGTFDPTTEVVRAAGSFQGWSPTTSPDMVDVNGDSIYVYTYRMPGNQEHQYKFLIGTDWGGDEANNRFLTLADRDTIVPVVYFDNDSVVTELTDGNITFQVRMDVMTEIGIFDPEQDSVQVRGGFNGWGDSDPLRSKMNQDFLDEKLWFLEVPFTQTGVGDMQLYKYYAHVADPNTIWTDGWERPVSEGGGNRGVAFAGTETQTVNPDGDGTEWYDDVHPDWVIPDGTTGFDVVFSVDMAPAKDPQKQAVPFNSDTDTLYWIGEQPTFVASQGWVDTDEMRVLKLTDDDGNDIFTGTLTVQAPSFNSFEYRYGWRGSDGTWTLEPAGFGSFAYRVRYVGQDAARNFPVLPWNMPMDTWTNSENKSDQQESDPFTSLVSIDEPVAKLNSYELLQNYPNPFNPVTRITYNLAQTGKVDLAIYNVLGQKVRTLFSGTASAGLHVNTWDGLDDAGKKVASGLYFYKLEAENYSAVKKMVLMK